MLQFRNGGGGRHCEIVTRNCPGYCGCLAAMLQVHGCIYFKGC